MDAAALHSAIVQSSDDAIVAKALDGRILSWNAGAERIFGYPAQDMIGRSVHTIIPQDRHGEEDARLAAISLGERVPIFETEWLHKEGHAIPVAITFSAVRDETGAIIAASMIARDSAKHLALAQRLEEQEVQFRLMADNIAQLAWIGDHEGSLFWYNRRWYEYTGASFSEMEGWGWQSVHDPEHLDRVTQRFRQHLESGEPWEDTFPLRGADGTFRWFLSHAAPIRDEHGKVRFWFGTSTDITEQRKARRQIELLLLEVNHRSKNMLAVVQSLARRTAASGGEFIERLERRIAALSANQDVVVSRFWADVPVQRMIEAQIAFLGESRNQIDYTGPEVAISPSAAEAISMALHELATNATKYGALANRGGRVTIVWKLTGCDNAARFEMRWRESDGPLVTKPTAIGFGSRIILDVPRGKLRAEVTVDYLPQGLVWQLSCPAENVLV